MPRPASRARGAAVYTKPPLSHSELVQRLRARGLVIDEQERAERCIRHLGYYRLSPYLIPFRLEPGSAQLRSGTTFDQVIEL